MQKVRDADREKAGAGEGGGACGAHLVAGVDYVVKEGGRDAWVPFPDFPEMETLTWVLVRNERPRNPSFHGAPQPKHGVGEEDRNGLLLMAYFRAFGKTWNVECRIYGISEERTGPGRRRRWNG